VDDFILNYYMHPYTFMGVFLVLFIYGVVHEYRSDSLIKSNNLSLKFVSRLLIFRIPSKINKGKICDLAWLKIQKLAREYIFVHVLIFSYFISGIFLALLL